MAASISSSLRLRRFLLSFPRNARAFAAGELHSDASAPGPSAASPAVRINGGESGSLAKFLLFLPGAITFGLGTWQIIRRQEKVEMIQHRQKRLDMDPIIWRNFNSTDEDLESLEFRKVECEGVFDERKSIYVGPRSRSISGLTENGYYLITPLIPKRINDSNGLEMPILVNRGWVPKEWRDNARNSKNDLIEEQSSPSVNDLVKSESRWWRFWRRKPESVQEQDHEENLVKILGVIRGSENPSIFVPANDPETGQWFYIDVPSMAQSSGLPDRTIYIEDINEKNAINPYPVPRDINSLIRYSVMPRDHLNYTFTWYALSAAVTFMAAKRVRMRKGRR